MTADTILLVGHGSREKSGNDEIFAFAEQWRKRQPGWRIEVCFIEFSDITMSEGLRRAATGAGRVLVVPLILNAAGHVKMDIPQAIDGARIKSAFLSSRANLASDVLPWVTPSRTPSRSTSAADEILELAGTKYPASTPR